MQVDRLEFHVLGDLGITWNTQDISRRLSRKSNVLLLYLALHRDQTFPREVLAQTFWNNSQTRSARYNLRHALWHIKKVIGGNSPIHTEQTSCRLSRKIRVESDYHRLETCHRNLDAMETSEIEDAIALYKGGFSSNVTLHQASEVNDWLFYMNSCAERLLFEATEYLALRYRKNGVPGRAIGHYEKLLQINPYHEKFHLALMESHLECRDPARAMEVFEKCKRLLRDELGTAPQKELKDLYLTLCRSRRPVSTSCPQPEATRTVNIESGIEFHGLAKLIAALSEPLDLSKMDAATRQDMARLSAIHPPMGHGCDVQAAPTTEAGFLYAFTKLVACFCARTQGRIGIEGIEGTDPKTRAFLTTLEREFRAENAVFSILSKASSRNTPS